MPKLTPLEWILLAVVVGGGFFIYQNGAASSVIPKGIGLNRLSGAAGAQGPLPGAGPGSFTRTGDTV